MAFTPLRSKTPAIDIYIKLAQYPILRDEIRLRMREELFRRGIVSQVEFEREVKNKAIESQRREGLHNPFHQEAANLWHLRKERVRSYITDAYFANNLGSSLFEQIIEQVLADQPSPSDNVHLTFNPEIAPWDMLFKQGKIYETLPPHKQEDVSHHLEEIKVVLIKGMISDQLPFIAVAKKVFSMDDLRRIYRRRIGRGKIGGKAAGMALAWKILQQHDPEFGPDISQMVSIPESFFIGTEVIYDFRVLNKIDHYMNQKYRPLNEIRRDYPDIVAAHLRGKFPDEVVAQLSDVLEQLGKTPLIVRSSSLLEDNFGFSFAGKYHSYFCPNQSTPEENLKNLLEAIRRVYASSLNPDAILYRQHNGLIDYDERMAVLLQVVKGEQYGRYFFPPAAGVAFSQNPFRWNPKIRKEDGFLRMVWGLGTRAVDRVDNDYPRMIALSHPQLRPETTAKAIRQYSQWYIDTIDLVDNEFTSLPIMDILDHNYPHLRLIASLDKGEYLQNIRSTGMLASDDKIVLTFENLIKDRKFIKLMRTALQRLEKTYKIPVDIEFTVEIIPNYPQPDFKLHILQCRPLSQRQEHGRVDIPNNITEKDKLFSSKGLIPNGKVEEIRYIVYIDPEKYHEVPNNNIKLELGRVVGRLNKILENENFILMGPGRWGSTNLELGVRVTYADIYNTKALIEIAVAKDGHSPELSYGTHFFQDLVEANIYSLPLHVGENEGYLDWEFFRETANALPQLCPEDAELMPYLQVIDLNALLGTKHRLRILMDGTKEVAVGYLESGEWTTSADEQGQISNF